MKRQLSGPAVELLERSNLPPSEIDAALDALVQNKAGAVLYHNHPVVQHIAGSTGLNLVQIARKSRHLLIQIEQQNDHGPLWQYREQTPRSCTFACKGQIPLTAQSVLPGKPLSTLATTPLGMDQVIINQVIDDSGGWVTVSVTPPWHIF